MTPPQRSRLAQLFAFPNPVNELAARTVAAGVLVLSVATLASGAPWLLIPLAYGFWARVLTGPTLSPLGQLATRVVVPVLNRPARPTPGPPKRFAQAVGVVFCTTALILWLTVGWGIAAQLVLGALVVAAFLESALGLCLGCKVFALLMRAGVVPVGVCEECADITRRHAGIEHRAA
jgi:hypothetical protein